MVMLINMLVIWVIIIVVEVMLCWVDGIICRVVDDSGLIISFNFKLVIIRLVCIVGMVNNLRMLC